MKEQDQRSIEHTWLKDAASARGRKWRRAADKGRPEDVRSARVFQTSTRSAILDC
jgi:hypothetical protein